MDGGRSPNDVEEYWYGCNFGSKKDHRCSNARRRNGLPDCPQSDVWCLNECPRCHAFFTAATYGCPIQINLTSSDFFSHVISICSFLDTKSQPQQTLRQMRRKYQICETNLILYDRMWEKAGKTKIHSGPNKPAPSPGVDNERCSSITCFKCTRYCVCALALMKCQHV